MTNAQLDSLDPTTLNPMEAILILAERLGLTGLAQKFEGRCWEHRVDDQWWFAINANGHEVTCTHGGKVSAYHVLVEFNGWPAGVLNVAGQGEFAMGDAANPDTFNAAVIAAAKALKP
jgi:hypothetical protein